MASRAAAALVKSDKKAEAPFLCGQPTKAGGSCKKTVKIEGAHCSFHKSDDDKTVASAGAGASASESNGKVTKLKNFVKFVIYVKPDDKKLMKLMMTTVSDLSPHDVEDEDGASVKED